MAEYGEKKYGEFEYGVVTTFTTLVEIKPKPVGEAIRYRITRETSPYNVVADRSSE